MNADALKILQKPFAPHEISLLPKQLKRDDTDKGQCTQGSRYSADGRYCGGYHARSIHLDYVGHAALTKRLLEADPAWAWEPLSCGPNGLPQFDQEGGLWIRLNLGGVSRLGYGDSQGKKGPNAIKEAIGDALRNAAMRFGAALDLWHKGDLYDADELKGLMGEPEETKTKTKPSGPITPTTGVWDEISQTDRDFLEPIARDVIGLIHSGDVSAACDRIESENLDAHLKVALWTRFDSKQRSAMKAHQEKAKGARG